MKKTVKELKQWLGNYVDEADVFIDKDEDGKDILAVRSECTKMQYEIYLPKE